VINFLFLFRFFVRSPRPLPIQISPEVRGRASLSSQYQPTSPFQLLVLSFPSPVCLLRVHRGTVYLFPCCIFSPPTMRTCLFSLPDGQQFLILNKYHLSFSWESPRFPFPLPQYGHPLPFFSDIHRSSIVFFFQVFK